MAEHSNRFQGNQLPRRGYLVGMNTEHITFFNWEKSRIFKVPTADNTGLVLGRFYKIGHYTFTESTPSHRVDFYVNRHAVAVDAYVVSPDPALLPHEIYDKYHEKTWSDQIGYCEDRFNVYWKNAKRGEKLFVTIQFLLGNFMICRVHNTGNPKEYGMNPSPPWDMETFGAVGIEYPPTPTPTDDFVQMHFEFYGPGICVSEDIPNVSFRREKRRGGSKELCHELFFPKFGLVRYFPFNSIIRRLPRQTAGDMGRWFYFKPHQQRNRRDEIPTYATRTAGCRVEVISPLRTFVIQGEITILTSFAFDHNVLESPENRLIENKRLRFQSLSDNAHFMDKILGRVIISKAHAQKMIEFFEGYMNCLPGRMDQHKNEKLMIRADVQIRPDYREFSMAHPGQGIFFMARLDQMIFEKSRIALYGDVEN